MIRRNNFQIARDILVRADDGAGVTQIVYGANLNFLVVKPYISDLISKAMIEKVGAFYYTTDLGRAFVRGLANTENAWAGVQADSQVVAL